VGNYYQDKIAVVTGGAAGLGRELCEELGRRGATVVAVDVDQEGAEAVCQAIRDRGGRALSAYLDVTIYENAQRIVKDVVKKYGRLDLIFNNAGTALHGEARDLSVEQWRTMLDVNLMGVIYAATSAYGEMVKQGSGQIVNIGSLAGLIPVPKEIPYCTSKWAVVGFTNALRLEGAGLGVKVNLVCPGIMRTAIHQTVSYVNVDQQKLVRPPTKHFVSPEKAARIILDRVAKNRAIIIFPFYAHLVWWLYRFNPAIFNLLFRKILKDFRKIRLS
jgi:NAD(P)-dependent dehydrogenase (short-subunit alcohol dehydrogenase family)